MEIIFATQNINKLSEINKMMPTDIHLRSLSEIGCEEDIPETHETIEENALEKAQYVLKHYQCNNFAEDTGLEVDALDGAPGVYSARYAGPQKNAEENVQLLLANLKGVSNRRARFKTVIALVLNGKEYLFEGLAPGNIIHQPKGDSGFGYDPIFQPDGYEITFAQMDITIKNQISHRARATKKLIDFLGQLA